LLPPVLSVVSGVAFGDATVMEMLLIGKLDVPLMTARIKQGMSQTACLDDVYDPCDVHILVSRC